MIRRRTLMAAAAASLAAPSLSRGAAAAPLKFIPQSDLTILDPIATTVYTARNHGMHGVRHAVRHGQRVPDPAADAGGLHCRGRRQAVEADAARRPAVARRGKSAGARLCRLDSSLGGARRHRQPADGAHRRTVRARRPDDPVPPEAAVPHPALRAGQDLYADMRDDAGASGQHRPVQAGHRNGRQRPVPLQGGRMGVRLARRLYEIRPLPSARRKTAPAGPLAARWCISSAWNGTPAPTTVPRPAPCSRARWIGGSCRQRTCCRS